MKNLPESVIKEFPNLPWKQIAGMCDIFIHQYFGVDLDLTWEVIHVEIPMLKPKLKALLYALEE